jgi:hypothetical protein
MTTITDEFESLRQDLMILPQVPEILNIYEQKYYEIKQREFMTIIDTQISTFTAKQEQIKTRFADKKGILAIALAEVQKKIDSLNEQKEMLKSKSIAFIMFPFKDFLRSFPASDYKSISQPNI